MAFSGDFTPVLAKHSKSFSLLDSISVGVDRMQRNLEPMRKQVETWRASELTTVSAKMIIYEAFIESELEVPKHLARTVHDLQSPVRGVQASDDLEPVERFHFRFQGTRPNPAI
jgi:hypothetical protein